MIYKFLALIILLTFYLCYLIKMLDQKKDGIKTDHLGKDTTGFPKVIEIVLKICSYIIAVYDIVSIILYTGNSPLYLIIAGIVLEAIGTGVFIKAVMDMKSNWRAGVSKNEHTELVTNGIYSWSRNPAFLGFYLTYYGIMISFFNIPLLIITVFTSFIFHLQIVNVEEDFLKEQFGPEYLDYMKSVNRYFGKKLNR